MPVIIMSSTVFNCAPKLPAGCNFLKSIFPNFLNFIVEIAIASPNANCDVVLAVGIAVVLAVALAAVLAVFLAVGK